ncbi:hypothetical protein JCM10212_002754 [Sporobolomyces blumeae]
MLSTLVPPHDDDDDHNGERRPSLLWLIPTLVVAFTLVVSIPTTVVVFFVRRRSRRRCNRSSSNVASQRRRGRVPNSNSIRTTSSTSTTLETLETHETQDGGQNRATGAGGQGRGGFGISTRFDLEKASRVLVRREPDGSERTRRKGRQEDDDGGEDKRDKVDGVDERARHKLKQSISWPIALKLETDLGTSFPSNDDDDEDYGGQLAQGGEWTTTTTTMTNFVDGPSVERDDAHHLSLVLESRLVRPTLSSLNDSLTSRQGLDDSNSFYDDDWSDFSYFNSTFHHRSGSGSSLPRCSGFGVVNPSNPRRDGPTRLRVTNVAPADIESDDATDDELAEKRGHGGEAEAGSSTTTSLGQLIDREIRRVEAFELDQGAPLRRQGQGQKALQPVRLDSSSIVQQVDDDEDRFGISRPRGGTSTIEFPEIVGSDTPPGPAVSDRDAEGQDEARVQRFLMRMEQRRQERSKQRA